MASANQTNTKEIPVMDFSMSSATDKSRLAKKIIDDHQGFKYKIHSETSLALEILNDIYTDTVLLVLEHIESGTFKGDSKLATYFYRIFYFKSVDFIRKNASNKIDYTNDLPDQRDDSQNISKLIEVTEEVKQIMKILDSMCSPCRELIMDWAYWGFKVDEIGARIGETDPVKFSKMKYNCIDKFKKLWNEKVSRM